MHVNGCVVCIIFVVTQTSSMTLARSTQVLNCGRSYSYAIALSGLFELYVRGGCLNHEAKPSGLNARLERTIQ